MTGSNYDRGSKEDEVLNRLIRASRDVGETDFVWPGDEAVTAYVLGTATPEQKERVQVVLSQSEAFRREMLQIMEDVAALSTPSVVSTMGSAAVVAPRFREFLETYGEPVHKPGAATSVWAWIKRLASARVYVPAAVVSAAAVVILILQNVLYGPITPVAPMVAQLTVARERVPIEELRSTGPLRSVSAESRYSYSVPESAAVAVMRDSLLAADGETGELHLTHWKPRQRMERPHRTVVLRVTDETGRALAEFAGDIPLTSKQDVAGHAVFILTLPDQTLRGGSLESDTTVVEWNMAWGTSGCIAYAYPCRNGFCAIPVSVFRFGDNQDAREIPPPKGAP